jgi:hypothetical protein
MRNGFVSDGEVIWVLPCDWPGTMSIHTITNLPAPVMSDAAVKQYVFDQCFVGEAAMTIVNGNTTTSWNRDAESLG